MTQYILQIKADTNDADYVTRSTEVTMEEIEELLPVIEAIKNFNSSNQNGYNWPDFEYHRRGDLTVKETYPDIDSKLLELFSEYCPTGEHGIHTIESVIYFPATQETKLL